MRPGNAPKANLGLFDRLSVKLLALFAATFLIAFLALWAYGISISYLESTLAEAAAPQAPQPVVIDPNLRNELSQVMAMPDATAEQAAIKDPFNDRTGLAGLSAIQRSGGTVTTSGPATIASNTTIVPGPEGPGAGPNRVVNSPPSAPVLSAKDATAQRWLIHVQRSDGGEIALDPRIFAVDDLLPVGIVDGGNGQQEVLFYSEAVAQTFSFPIGTMFFDGWLSELRPDGVVFAMNDARRSAKLRVWARNLRSVG